MAKLLAKLAASAALWAPLKASSSAQVSVAAVDVGRWWDDDEPLAAEPSGRSSVPSGVGGAWRQTVFTVLALVLLGCSASTCGVPGPCWPDRHVPDVATLRHVGRLGEAARSTSDVSGLACGGTTSMWHRSVTVVGATASSYASDIAGREAADDDEDGVTDDDRDSVEQRL